jgi:PAS domain S-box-containing protein
MFRPIVDASNRWFTLRRSMQLLTGLNLLVCIVTVWNASSTLSAVGIGGKFYQQVVTAHGLEADILPPPAFIVELHLLMHDFGVDQTPQRASTSTQEFLRLKANFISRAEFWQNELPDGDLKRQLVEKAIPPVIQYIGLAEEMLSRATIETPFDLWMEYRDHLHLLYDSHFDAINELARMARVHAAQQEAKAIALTNLRSLEFGILGFALILVLAGINYRIGQYVTSRLAETTSLLERVAAGDLTQRLAVSGVDEIDHLAGYLNQAIEASAANLKKATDTAAASESLLVQLREQESITRGVLNSVPEAIITLDSQQSIIEFNPEAERLFGSSRASVIGKSFQEVEIFAGWSCQHSDIRTSLSSESHIQRVETVVKSISGADVPVSLAVAEANSNGHLITVICLMNISEELESRRQIESLARFPDESPAPVARVSSQGVVLYANRVARKGLTDWNINTGGLITDEALLQVERTLLLQQPRLVEQHFDDRIFSLLLVPVVESGYVNIYGNDCTDRRRMEKDRQDLNDQLISTARQAGMAEMATGVLHNVGNVLNSVNVATTLLRDAALRSRVPRVNDLANLLLQQQDLAQFFTTDPRGIKFPEYLSKLASQLAEENSSSKRELDSLTNHVSHIKSIIATQQSIASTSGVVQPCCFEELIDEAIEFQLCSIERHGIRIERDYSELPELMLDRHKVMQIMVNLIKNAKEAVRDSGREDGCISVTLRQSSAETVAVSVRDTGVGIASDVNDRIFAHGFTTKKDGHGFGLHSCANFATEMEGNLRLASDGLGHGATFTLELPYRPVQVVALSS